MHTRVQSKQDSCRDISPTSGYLSNSAQASLKCEHPHIIVLSTADAGATRAHPAHTGAPKATPRGEGGSTRSEHDTGSRSAPRLGHCVYRTPTHAARSPWLPGGPSSAAGQCAVRVSIPSEQRVAEMSTPAEADHPRPGPDVFTGQRQRQRRCMPSTF